MLWQVGAIRGNTVASRGNTVAGAGNTVAGRGNTVAGRNNTNVFMMMARSFEPLNVKFRKVMQKLRR